MARILKAAIQHRGFAFVEMLQACPKALATQVQDRIAYGVLDQRKDIPHFYDRLIPRQGLETTCVEEVRRYDVSEYWKEMV
jgi:2-oxoglutarate ferredoxin oxidoreductase subunit beta